MGAAKNLLQGIQSTVHGGPLYLNPYLPQATTLVGEEIVKVYVLLPNQGLQPHSHDEPEEIHVG